MKPCDVKWCVAMTDSRYCPIHTAVPDYKPSDATRLQHLYDAEMGKKS